MPDISATRLLRGSLTVAAAMVLAVPLLGAGPAVDTTDTAAGTTTVDDDGGWSSSGLAPREDATYSEHYFPSSDGINTLHADVLRPAHLDADEPTPVILTVTPYANHSGSLPYPGYFDPTAEGPNERFYDFLDLSGALEQGYTYVMVDLPGNGGSSGCNDWGGPREQGAVKDAVEWAAGQDWSTGKVALLGKSYDGWTGLMGIAQQPDGLAAVVSMEPVFSGYRYLYDDGVRFTNSVATPAIFQAADAQPGSSTDDPEYHANGAPQAWCYGVNMGLQQQDDASADFWVKRDLLRTTADKHTPLFLTQGFLEANTKPDGAFDYWNGLPGEDNRAWFGQFDHVRGWEKSGDDRFHTGRAGFVAEVMRFLDEHLKGIEPTVEDPAIVVQDNLGRYRAETAWPPADAGRFTTAINGGTYTDDGSGSDTSTEGIWSVSQQLPHDVWLAGEPMIGASADAVPRSNITANVYDIAPDGTATLVSRGTRLLRGNGVQSAGFELYGQDWVFEAGHRIGVRVTDANSNWWVHVGTNADVTVSDVEVTLPLKTTAPDTFLDGGSTPRLEDHLASETFPAAAAISPDTEIEFAIPGPLG